MKKRLLVIAGVTIIAATSIAGYAFAEETNFVRPMNATRGYLAQEGITERNFSNHCGNSEDMIQAMRENGFEDMIIWMEEGDFKSMDEFMNNLSDEDYEKMIDLMRENGYGNKARMMESVGREGMTNMHNSMMRGKGARFNMMGRFQ
ncbi:hypothetical protein [Alkaliphilus peptidifermentans]|uniref:DUF2680 domain-containing protein n=1 Tax=Alkaliphilus peptidifermentans DSM 18978 TaxID=1120976 RepID=A0A1G5E578_9FIRM|nr:hypothetical protein [Alkaliphilus peptidifermentans]SCY22047.1 hypothetical protein SAMN03080606_01050 [Alkaliphilus peptidifermentans DSM 18978]